MVRSANGALVHVAITHPVWIRDPDPEGKSCQMQLLVLPQCPVNLLGRDGLIALGLSIVPTPRGLKIVRGIVENPPNSSYLLGTDPPPAPQYIYTLDVKNDTPDKYGSRLHDLGGKGPLSDNDQMKTEDLHITMWRAHDLDSQYDDDLYKVSPVEVTATWQYLDLEGRAVVAVQLPEEAKNLYREKGTPYIALSKPKTENWSVLRDMASRGEATKDWRSTGLNTWWSDELKMSKQALFWSRVVTWKGIHTTDLDD